MKPPLRSAPWVLGTVLTLTAALAAPVAWAEVPRPLTLPEATRIAWEQGPDLEDQRRAVAVAEVQARQAGVPFRPQAGLGADYTVSEGEDGAVIVRLDLSQSLALRPLLGGAPPAELRQAELALEQARRRLEEARQDTAGAVLRAYLDLLEARSAVERARATQQRAESLLAQTEDRARRQAATEADLYEARASALSARQQVAEAELGALKAQSELNRILGLPLRTSLELAGLDVPEAGASPVPAPDEATVDALIAHALAHRLELSEAREALAEARTDLAELKQPFEPTLSFTGGYSGKDGSIQASLPTDTWELDLSGQAQLYPSTEGGPTEEGGFTPGEDPRLPPGWSAGAALSLPLLDGGSRRAAREAQTLQLEELDAQLQDLEASVAEEVRQALEAYLLATETVPVRELQLEAARVRLEAEQKRFQAGAIAPRDLADAQDAYDTALADHASARLQVLRAAADLQRAAALPVAGSDGTWIRLEEALPQEEDESR